MCKVLGTKTLLLANLALVFNLLISLPCRAQESWTLAKIGLLIPLTGDAAYFGSEVRRGAEIALQRLHNAGKKIELVFEDEKCLAKDAVTGYRALITAHKVDFIIGPSCTGSIMAVAPLAKAEGRPLLALWDAGKLVESAGEHVFALGYDTEAEGALMARYAVEQKLPTAGVVWEEDQFASLVKEAFEKEYERLGGKVLVSESIQPAEPDVRAVLTKVIAKKPQAIFLSPAYSAATLVSQLKRLGYKGKVLGQDTFAAPDVIKAGGTAMNGLLFANIQLAEQDPKARHLFEEYKKHYKGAPESLVFAAFGYDSVQIAATVPHDLSRQQEALRTLHFSDGALPFDGFLLSRMSRLEPQIFAIENGGAHLLAGNS